MTDVLKMVVLPSAQEITDILTSEDNSTDLPESPKLNFILQAIEYWRKHNMPDSLENLKGENATQLTFNLKDDFFDDDGTAYSHLSKKLQNTHKLQSVRLHPTEKFQPIKKTNDRPSPVPYVYVKNFYLTDHLYAKRSQSKKN